MGARDQEKNKLRGLFFQVCLCVLLAAAAIVIRGGKSEPSLEAGAFGGKSPASLTLTDLAANTGESIHESEFWTAFFRIND